MSDVVGREREVEVVCRFVEEASHGPGALLLAGDPGIGKTTLWRVGLAAGIAHGFAVLQARPTAAEATLSLAGLTDLLKDVADTAVAALPDPQREALEVALLRRRVEGDTEVADPRALGMAVLEILRDLEARSPVVIAIDDAHWFDGSSASVLAFALRRLAPARVRILATARTTADDARGLESFEPVFRDVERVPVGPLSVDELRNVVRSRLGATFARPVQRQIHQASGGNPFFALEIARALTRESRPAQPGEPLPVPDSLRELVRARVSALSDDALEAALVTSATARPTRDTVAAVLGDSRRASRAIEEAERAEVLEQRAGLLSFTHPLLASTVYNAVPAEQRRRLHATLAAVAVDAEVRARHLALSTDHPDPAVVAALEQAAGAALRRGATDGAARLLEQALALVPSEEGSERVRVLLAVAAAHSHAGGYVRARELIAEAARAAEPGPSRARVLHQLAEATYMIDGAAAAEAIHRQALGEVEDDVALRVYVLKQLAWYAMARGAGDEAEGLALQAVRLAEKLGEPLPLMSALDGAGDVLFRRGDTRGEQFLARAVALEHAHGDLLNELLESERPSETQLAQMLWGHRLAELRPRLLAWHDEMLAAGEEGQRCTALWMLAQVECWSGNLELARRHAEEAYETILGAERLGEMAPKAFVRALVCAHSGLEDEARALADEAHRRAREVGAWYTEIRALATLGFLELSLGRVDAARAVLDEAAEKIIESGYGHPAFFGGAIPDAAEARVASGDLDGARSLVEWLEARASALQHAWALEAATRARGLLLAAAGETPRAVAVLSDAVVQAEALGEPIELGRSLLALGTVQRRANQRKAARESLERAVTVFERLNAPLWVERVREELARVSGRAPATDALTETEARVAALVAEGLTNREVAGRLFITPRTVEANLTRVFAKLGLRSRSELAARYPAEVGVSRS